MTKETKNRDIYSKNLEKFEKFLKDKEKSELKKETINKNGQQIQEKN